MVSKINSMICQFKVKSTTTETYRPRTITSWMKCRLGVPLVIRSGKSYQKQDLDSSSNSAKLRSSSWSMSRVAINFWQQMSVRSVTNSLKENQSQQSRIRVWCRDYLPKDALSGPLNWQMRACKAESAKRNSIRRFLAILPSFTTTKGMKKCKINCLSPIASRRSTLKQWSLHRGKYKRNFKKRQEKFKITSFTITSANIRKHLGSLLIRT